MSSLVFCQAPGCGRGFLSAKAYEMHAAQAHGAMPMQVTLQNAQQQQQQQQPQQQLSPRTAAIAVGRILFLEFLSVRA